MQTFDVIKQKFLQNHSHTWLITGVAGFIGSHLLDFLLAQKQKVIGLDNFSTGYQKNLTDVLHQYPNSQFIFMEGDIRDQKVCHSAMQQVDFVLHHAAIGSVPRSIQDPITTHEVNVNGFLHMLMAAKESRVKRFIYASSSSVYGDSIISPKQELQLGNPLSPYAVSKITNELYAKVFANCYGLPTIGLRYFNVFGARQDPNGPYAAVIPQWIHALLHNKDVYINGDGQTSRDFCYVENAVQANVLAAFAKEDEALNTSYNIAVGQSTTLEKLYKYLKKDLGQLNHQPIFREFRPGDIKHSLADIQKAQQNLGYQPSHDIVQGLSETIRWYKLNSNFEENVLNGE